MTSVELRNLGFTAIGLGLCALLPLADSGYWLSIGLSIAMFTVLATSWALFSGPTHYISLATAAFFGVGTYTTGLSFETLPFWVYPIGFLLMLGSLLWFESNARKLGRVGMEQMTEHLRTGGLRNVVGGAGSRMRERFQRPDDFDAEP